MRRHLPPAPAVVIMSTVMFLAGLAGASVAVLIDKLYQRFVQG